MAAGDAFAVLLGIFAVYRLAGFGHRLFRDTARRQPGDELLGLLAAVDVREVRIGHRQTEEFAQRSPAFLHPEHEGLLTKLGVGLDARRNVAASPEHNYQTSVPKVFAAGDMRRGQSLVVWAIAEGRECARSVDAFLNGGTSVLEARDGGNLALAH